MLPWNPSPSYSAGHGPPSAHHQGSSDGQSTSYGNAYNASNMTAGSSSNAYNPAYNQGPPPSFNAYQPGQQNHPSQQQQPPQQPQLSPAQPPLQLSQVLHWLQTEFRRHDRDRNEWEIERGEMRARIALLEGERRGSENLRADLLRRVKMLEFALRGERSKYLSTASAPPAATPAASTSAAPAGASAIPPAKAALLKQDERPASSIGSSPPSDGEGAFVPSFTGLVDARRPAFSDGASQSSQPQEKGSGISAIPSHVLSSRPSSAASLALPANSVLEKGATAGGPGSTFGGTSGPAGWNPAIGRDPKGRARSRDYLKQCVATVVYSRHELMVAHRCLQEIAYLTSPATLNPLPDRTADGVPRPQPKVLVPIPPLAQQQQQASSQPTASLPTAPLVTSAAPSIPTLARNAPDLEINVTSAPLPPEYPPSIASAPMELSRSSEGIPAAPPLSTDLIESIPAATTAAEQAVALTEETANETSQYDTIRHASSAPTINGIKSHPVLDAPHREANGWINGEERLTAVFRPESSDAWKAQLRAAGGRSTDGRSSPPSIAEAELSSLGLTEIDDDARSATSSKKEEAANGEGEPRMWRSKKSLRSHLDAVRCLAFDRSDMTLASGSDDGTVKVWRLNPAQLAVHGSTKAGSQPDIEPNLTLRGHSGPVTALAISPSSDRLYSASMDQTVQIWSLPARERETFAPYDSSLRLGRLEGHSDAIWSMALVPLRVRDEALLATASADGTVKVWSTEGANGPALKLSWGYGGTDGSDDGSTAATNLPAPTSVGVVHFDMRKLAVGYQDSVVKLFDIETGRQLLRLRSDEGVDRSSATQVNAVVAHPTLPLLVTAHEDGNIKFFDLNSGACTQTVLAHSDAVTSIDIDPSGLTLASAGHDNSVRFWDLLSTRTCVQEISAHRSKAGEGALDVKYHANLPFLASSGADGLIKVYA